MTTAPGPGGAETLAGLLLQAQAADADRDVVRFVDGPSLTTTGLLEAAARTAGVFQAQGLRPGDRVAIVLPNRQEFLWAYFGAAYAGAVSVPVNVDLRGPILEHMLRQSEPRIVVVGREFAATVQTALKEIGSPATVLSVGRADPGLVDLAEAVPGADEGELVTTDPQSLAVILYTAGTTGPSKGIMICNRMALSFPRAVSECLEYRPDDVMHNVLPLFHGNAINISLLPALMVGGTAVFGSRFSASRWWSEVREAGATAISLLGSMVPILWGRPESELDRDHRVRVALAVPAPVGEYEAFERRFGLRLASLYGMTDCGLVILTPPQGGRPGYAGVAHRDWECRVVDDLDEDVPDGEVGELVLRPRRPFITQLGYWRAPEATVDAWRNLWFHTGDRLVRDPDGWFRFVDRKKDAIRRFGENISSFEVESVIQSHPAVAEAAVFPVPAEMEEDEVMAAVVLEPGATCAPEELFAYCRELLPYFAVPRYIEIRANLPKTPTEKVRKEVLRAEGVTPATWDHGPTGRRAQARAQAQRA